ncbi:MAG: HD domain-containing protein [Anaerolineae bacterium]
MRKQDPVYGTLSLEHPLLADLYRSQAVQRLAQIYQGGVTAFVKPERITTRLDHSLGVMGLLQRLGADIVEQAAGLLHDVPHTAFSHVVDFVFPNHDHTYHERHSAEVIAHSDLPAILAAHGLDWRHVTEPTHFPLLEQPLPALCADRLDYFLRDGLTLGYLQRHEVTALLEHLHAHRAQIVVTDLEAARWLGERFMALDDAIWCSVQEVGWYAAMARALRAALESGLLTEADFGGTDAPLMARLRASDDAQIRRRLALLRPDVDFVRVDIAEADLVALPKVRAIDPPVLSDGRVTPLSMLDPSFAQQRAAYVQRKQGHWGLKIDSTEKKVFQ